MIKQNKQNLLCNVFEISCVILGVHMKCTPRKNDCLQLDVPVIIIGVADKADFKVTRERGG